MSLKEIRTKLSRVERRKITEALHVLTVQQRAAKAGDLQWFHLTDGDYIIEEDKV